MTATRHTLALQTKGLHWKADNTEILKNISLSFHAGKSYGIIGPNGAGKTSLLKCLQRLNRPSAGQVLLENKDIWDYTAKTLARHVAWLPQIFSSPISLNVEQMIKLGLVPHKKWFQRDSEDDLQDCETALRDCEVEHLRERSFALLSGGEQQRVLLARALVQRASVFLLDELTSHLDVYYQHQLLSLVTQLNKTIIMTIHDLNLAAQYLDELILLKDGKVITTGTPSEVLRADILQEVFALRCDVSVSGKGVPMVCFSHE